MKTTIAVVTTLAAMFASPLAAQEGFIEGVYLPSPELCAQAQAEGIDNVLEAGELALTAEGLHGYEYHCDFLQVLPGARTPGWTIIAMCEEPDFAFSDLITLVMRSEGQLDLVSLALRSSAESEESDSAGSLEQYVLCEGLESPWSGMR